MSANPSFLDALVAGEVVAETSVPRSLGKFKWQLMPFWGREQHDSGTMVGNGGNGRGIESGAAIASLKERLLAESHEEVFALKEGRGGGQGKREYPCQCQRGH